MLQDEFQTKENTKHQYYHKVKEKRGLILRNKDGQVIFAAGRFTTVVLFVLGMALVGSGNLSAVLIIGGIGYAIYRYKKRTASEASEREQHQKV